MKKQKLWTGLFCLILITFFQPAYAGGDGGIGIKGGLAISTLGNEDESFKDARARFRLGGTGGLSYEFATDGTFAFDVEMLYDLRGAKQKFSDSGSEVVIKDYLHYINFPMSLKFYIGDVFNIHFGGYVGVAVAGKRKYEGTINIGGTTFTSDSEHDLFNDVLTDLDPQGDEYLKRFDGGILVGLEFIGEKGIGVGTRGYVGLADITNDDHFLGNKRSSTGEISVYAIFRIGR
jgi:hypothetical protein